MDLNEPYLKVNDEYMKRNQTDYLALMGAPDELAPPLPRYVNGHILPEIRKSTKFSSLPFCLDTFHFIYFHFIHLFVNIILFIELNVQSSLIH